MPIPFIGAALGGLAAGIGLKVLDYATGNDADSQTRLSAQLGQQNWKQQFDLQNEYEAPINQVARLKEAGINPYLGSSQISTGSSGNLSPSYSPPVSHYQSMSETMNQSMAAYKALEEGSVTKPLAEADIDAKRAESALNRVREDREQLNLALDREFGKSERDQALKNKVQELMNMEAEREKLQGEARLVKAQENLAYLKSFQQEFDNVAAYHNSELSKKIVDNYDARIQSELAVQKSEQLKNYSSAEEFRQAAKLAGEQAREVGFRNEIQSFKNQWFKANRVQELNNYLSALDAEGVINNTTYHEAVARLKIAAKKGREDWFMYCDWLLDKVNLGAYASGAANLTPRGKTTESIWVVK